MMPTISELWWNKRFTIILYFPAKISMYTRSMSCSSSILIGSNV
jgi:hypothetical protein